MRSAGLNTDQLSSDDWVARPDADADIEGSRGRIRVVMYEVSPRGGSHASLCTLVRCLDPAIEVSVVSTRPETAAELAGLRSGSEILVVAPVRNKADLLGVLRHARAVRALRPDVLHVSCDNPWSAPYGLLAGLILRCPTVAVVHGPAPAWRRRQRWLVRMVTRRLDAVVSVSDASAREVERSLGAGPLHGAHHLQRR